METSRRRCVRSRCRCFTCPRKRTCTSPSPMRDTRPHSFRTVRSPLFPHYGDIPRAPASRRRTGNFSMITFQAFSRALPRTRLRTSVDPTRSNPLASESFSARHGPFQMPNKLRSYIQCAIERVMAHCVPRERLKSVVSLAHISGLPVQVHPDLCLGEKHQP
jgi:hypothetical protein